MFIKWLRNRRKNRRWQEYREWFQQSQEARTLTFLKCFYCHTPASSAEANFCAHCGAALHSEPGFHTEPGLYTTEPLLVNERPFQAYRRQMQQQDASEMPTRRFRTMRLDRLPEG